MDEFTYKGKTLNEWKLSFIERWMNDAMEDLNRAFEWWNKNPQMPCCEEFALRSLDRAIREFQYAAHIWNSIERT